MTAEEDHRWTPLAGVDPVSAGFPVSVRFDERPIWIFRGERGDFFGVQDTCPHTDQTLGTAKITGGGAMIRCVYHNYTFRLANGKGVNCPGFHIDVFDVKEEDRRLFVRRKLRE